MNSVKIMNEGFDKKYRNSLCESQSNSREAEILDKTFEYLRDIMDGDAELYIIAKDYIGMSDDEINRFCGDLDVDNIAINEAKELSTIKSTIAYELNKKENLEAIDAVAHNPALMKQTLVDILERAAEKPENAKNKEAFKLAADRVKHSPNASHLQSTYTGYLTGIANWNPKSRKYNK